MRRQQDKTGDTRGRPGRQSSILGDPSAKFFAEKRGTGTNSQKSKQRRGQEFLPAAVHLKESVPRIVRISSYRPEWSSINGRFSGFEVTINGRFWGDH